MQLTRRSAARLASLAAFSSLALAGCNHSATTDNNSSMASLPGGDPGTVATLTTPKGATLSVTGAGV